MADFNKNRDDDEARHTAMYKKRNGAARKLDLTINPTAEGDLPAAAARTLMSPVSRLAENLEGGFSIRSPQVPGLRQPPRRQVSFPDNAGGPSMSPPQLGTAAALPPTCPTHPMMQTSPLGEKGGCSPMDLGGQKENNFTLGRRRPSINRAGTIPGGAPGMQPLGSGGVRPGALHRSHSMSEPVLPTLDFVDSPIVVRSKKTKRCMSMDEASADNVASSFNETRSSGGSSLASSWEPASPPKFPYTHDTGMDSPKCLLPTIHGAQPDLKNIAAETLVDLMDGKYKNVIDDYIIVDCRYPYEFEGGRITGAVNLCNPVESSSFFFKELVKKASVQNVAIILHCEFSTKRGPKMWRHIRNLDRKFNHESYPNLYFKDMYVLEGGYKLFYEKYSQYCKPMDYVMMHDPSFSTELKDSTQEVRRSWAKTKQQTEDLLRFSV